MNNKKSWKKCSATVLISACLRNVVWNPRTIVVHHIVILLLSEQEYAVKFLELRATIKTASSMITKRQNYERESLLYNFIIYNVFLKLLFIFHDTLLIKKAAQKRQRDPSEKYEIKRFFATRRLLPFSSVHRHFLCFLMCFFIHNRKLSRMSGKERVRRRVHFIVINEKLCWCQRKTEDGQDKTRMTNLLKYSS